MSTNEESKYREYQTDDTIANAQDKVHYRTKEEAIYNLRDPYTTEKIKSIRFQIDDFFDGVRYRDLPNYTKTSQELKLDNLPTYTKSDYPNFDEIPLVYEPDNLDDLSKFKDKFNKLYDEIDGIKFDTDKAPYLDDKLFTDTSINGEGIFDKLCYSYLSQLENLRGMGLLENKEVSDIFSRSLAQIANISSQYVFQKENARVQLELAMNQRLIAKSQLLEAKVKALLIETQLEQMVYQNALLRRQCISEYWNGQKIKSEIPSIQRNIDLIAEQIEGQRLQNNVLKLNAEVVKQQLLTEKANIQDTIDGKAVEGKVAVEKRLIETQTLAYQRDTMLKFFEMILQGWQTKKASDIAVMSPDCLTSHSVDSLAQTILSEYFKLDPDVVIPPHLYKEYLTKEELSGNEPIKAIFENTVSDKQ